MIENIFTLLIEKKLLKLFSQQEVSLRDSYLNCFVSEMKYKRFYELIIIIIWVWELFDKQ